MNSTLDINTKAAAEYARKLDKINRSALPVAIRQTLNKAAFDVKQRTMPASADTSFVKRDRNFFKANSKVVQAQGFELSSMKSTVGFTPLSGTNHAVDDLEQQEHGGHIGGRSLVGLNAARTSKSWRKKVRQGYRIKDISDKIIDSEKTSGANGRQKYIKAAIRSGKGGFVIGNIRTNKGNRIVLQIRSIIRKNGNTVVKALPIYAVKSHRKVKPKATHFMESASRKSAGRMEEFFIDLAKKQIDKYK